MRRSILVAAVVALDAGWVAPAGAELLGPTPYLSAADSPAGGLGLATLYLEDFEDGALNVPGLSASAGVVQGPGFFMDSVDGDDGTIDGLGLAGHSWYLGTTSTVSFSFDAAALGGFPTYAGMVWTDVGNTTGTPGVAAVTFEAFDAGGVSLGTLGPVTLGDGVVTGGTAEDRFFGVTNAGGISRITMTIPTSTDWEVDHVQYGFIPEPAGVTAMGAAALAAGVRRRKAAGL